MSRLAGQFKPLNLTVAAVLILVAIGGFLWRSNQIGAVRPDAQRPPTLTAFVHDHAGMINASTTRLNQSLHILLQTHDIEAIIVTVGRVPDEMTLEQLAHKLIDNWQIGETHRQRGLLLLVAAEKQKLQIGVRSGLSEIFTDTFCRHFQSWQWPRILDTGATTAALLKVVTEIQTRAELTRNGRFTTADLQRFDRNLPPSFRPN